MTLNICTSRVLGSASEITLRNRSQPGAVRKVHESY